MQRYHRPKDTELKSGDSLGKEVYRRFTTAKSHRSTDRIGDKSVEEILTNCYNQYHGILSPCDRELVEQSGVDLYLSITHLKVNTATNFVRDLINTQNDVFVTLDPTPVPEISQQGREYVISQLRDRLLQLQQPMSEPEQYQMIKEFKEAQLQQEIIIAKTEAGRQQRIVNDELIQNNFKRELLKFVGYFMRDPYAVMVGGIKRGENVLTWSGNTLTNKVKQGIYSHAVDPRDYFYSPDATGRGEGAYEITRETMARTTLQQLVNKPGWIGTNISHVLTEYSQSSPWDWLANGGREQRTIGIPWGINDSIDVLRHFGKVSGRELRAYGASLEDDKMYEVMTLTIGGYTIKIDINVDLNNQRRRVYTSSYERSADRVAGISLAQNIRDIERGFMSTVRAMVENIGFSAVPGGEVDFSRVQRYIPAEDIGQVYAGMVVPTDPDVVGGNRPAHTYHNHPNLTGAFANAMSYWMQLADQFSGVPAQLHGQPIGTGANRTFRGMLALYSNAMKGFQSGLTNLDEDILTPLGNTYHYDMRKEHKFKGDARVNVSGITGILKAELRKQESLENMQIIGQVASSNPQGTPSGVLEYTTSEVLKALGVPAPALNTPSIAEVQQQQALQQQELINQQNDPRLQQ